MQSNKGEDPEHSWGDNDKRSSKKMIQEEFEFEADSDVDDFIPDK